MHDLYLAGVVVAFTIGLIKLVMTVSALFSVRTRNMRQIGLHYALMTATYVPEKSGPWSLVGFALYQLALAPAASWLSVISALWGWMRWRSSQASTPEELKRLQYRVANITMNKQQMIEWQEEISKVLGVAGPVRTGASDDHRPLVLVLEPGGWYRELRMQPDKRMLEFYGHTPDYDGIFRSTYEYRFDGMRSFRFGFEARRGARCDDLRLLAAPRGNATGQHQRLLFDGLRLLAAPRGNATGQHQRLLFDGLRLLAAPRGNATGQHQRLLFDGLRLLAASRGNATGQHQRLFGGLQLLAAPCGNSAGATSAVVR